MGAVIIQTKLFFKNFAGLCIKPFIFVKDKEDKTLINHEMIHLQQQKELGLFKFLYLYLKELRNKGYRNISFEKEAYGNEDNLDYLNERKPYAFKNYL
jgi:hypothetical protein